MTTLLLKSANASRGGSIQWDAAAYDVREILAQSYLCATTARRSAVVVISVREIF